MTKNEQIEEMARVYDEARLKARGTLGSMNEGEAMWYSKAFYAKGYRKVERGEWKYDFTLDDYNFYRCSICDRQETLLAKESVLEYFPYCHCGADMRKEGEE